LFIETKCCLYSQYIQRKNKNTKTNKQTPSQTRDKEQDEEVTICSLEQNVVYNRVIYTEKQEHQKTMNIPDTN